MFGFSPGMKNRRPFLRPLVVSAAVAGLIALLLWMGAYDVIAARVFGVQGR